MKNSLKNLLIIIISLVIFMTILIYLGSIDHPDYDDKGLLKNIRLISDSNNGYNVISFIDNDFSLSIGSDNQKKISAHVNYEVWDNEFAQQIIDKNAHFIESTITAVQFESFQLNLNENSSILPNYAQFLPLSQLVILKSMSLAKSGQYEQAIKLAETAVAFSQRIKMEKNYILVSHMFGLRMQNDILLWLHHLAVDYSLNDSQYRTLLVLFDQFPAYDNDSFNNVFAGELKYTQTLLTEISQSSLSERWELSQYQGMSFLGQPFDFFYTMLPNYYLHKNTSLHQSAIIYSDLKLQAHNYCAGLNFKKDEIDDEISWVDMFLPNLMFKINPPDKKNFKNYFYRRCFGHTYINSVKTIIALKAFEHKTGDIPDNLHALIPDYLTSLPVDALNGEPLGYSKNNRWLYSVGDNFENNGGAIQASYFFRCDREQYCSRNPTFPINPDLMQNIPIR